MPIAELMLWIREYVGKCIYFTVVFVLVRDSGIYVPFILKML